MQNVMRRFSLLFEMQLKEFTRDFGSMFFSFVFPLFFAIAIVAVNSYSPGFTFKFGVVDQSHNADGDRFMQLLARNKEIEARRTTKERGERALKDGDLQALLFLPAGNLSAAKTPVKLETAPFYADFASMAVDLARYEFATGASGARLPVAFDAVGRGTSKTNLGFRYDLVTPSSATQTQNGYLFPGLLALALLELGLFATAAPLLRARERGTFRHLMLTPLRTLELLSAQVTLRGAVAVAQISLLIGVGVYAGMHLGVSSALLLVVASLLGIVMLISLAYALVGISPNLESGLAIIMIANFTMLFLGNVFWDPRNSMFPHFLGYLMPLTYLSDMFRQVLNGVSGILPLWVDVVAMLGWTALALFLAVKTFRFDATPRINLNALRAKFAR